MKRINSMQGLLGLCFGLIVCLQLSNGSTVNQQNITKVDQILCDTGFFWDQEINKCRPKCDPTCGTNAVCVWRDTCQCNQGYVEEKGVCQPICSQGCENGNCIAPDKCRCDEGFLWDQKTRKCQPICNPRCTKNDFCSAPDVCTCFKDYIEEKGVCQPICLQGCEHGTCIAPERCRCDDGYLWNQKMANCQPVCNPQCKENAICSAPDVCTCFKDYIEENGVCQPICSHGCGAHGRCVAPEKCDCSTGYEWDKKSSKCLPRCFPKCGSHSFCHRTNECKCMKGYKPNDIHSLSCSLPLHWWIYVLIGIMTIVILCSVVFIIYYFVARSRNVSYYPNSNFTDTNRIVE